MTQEEKYFSPLIREGTKTYIANVDTTVSLITLDDQTIPITITNPSHLNNSYVASPYNFYIGYAFETFSKFKNPFLKNTLFGLLHIMKALLPINHLDKVVTVNNWLLSTNLYPKLNQAQIKKLISILTNQYPEHAILFRNLNKWDNPQTFSAIQQSKALFIPSRMIYCSDGKNDKLYSRRVMQSDIKLLENSGYEIITDFNSNDLERVYSLYHMLNIQKQSTLNPEFTLKFIHHLYESNLLKFKALKKNNQIDAVFGYYEKDGVMTCPFFGYDLTKPKELYRINSTLLLLEARDKKYLFNQSAGGSVYKKIRLAEPVLDYNAVYCNHLPAKQKYIWNILNAFMNGIGKHIMLKFDF